MNKQINEKKLMKIGDVAKIMGVTRRIIINYEDHGLIQADTRGEFSDGYRYYSMDTLVRIRTIRTYQSLGLSLKEIKTYLDENADLEPAIKRLEELRAALDVNIAQLRERMKKDAQNRIAVIELPEYTVYSEASKYTALQDRIKQLRDVAYSAIVKYGAESSKLKYFSEKPLTDPDKITYFATVPKGSKGEGILKLPSVKALVGYHHGSYETLFTVKDSLVRYAEENAICLTGVCRYIFLEGPPQHKDPQNYLTMVALLVAE